MNINTILTEISQKDFDKEKFTEMILHNETMRDEIVSNMIYNPNIMIYYHCFYIIESATENKPALFYKYWNDFSRLLFHRNSYHRNFGLILLANLAIIDDSNLFAAILDDYCNLLFDQKFMTAETCIKQCKKIGLAKSELANDIVDKLLFFHKKSEFSEKQIALAKGFIIETFDTFLHNVEAKKELVLAYVHENKNSISPKTQKIALNFLKKQYLSQF